MANTTFKVLLKDRPLASGLYAVRIRITRSKQHAYYNTGLSVKRTEFNKVGNERLRNWIKEHRQHKTYNDNLTADIDALRELGKAHPAYTASELRQAYRAPAAKSEKGLLAFWQVWIDRKRAMGKEPTARLYETARSYLLRYAGPDPDETRVLTPRFAADYLTWLLTEDKEKKKKAYAPSTSNGALSHLDTVYRKALLEGWVPQAGDPFGSVEATEKPRKRRRPDFSVVRQMMALPLTPGMVEWDARNCFLLQFYLHGGRVSEILTLEWEDVKSDRVEYGPNKRGKRLKSVPINQVLRWVLARCERRSRFVLPYLQEQEAGLPPSEFLRRVQSGSESVRYGLRKISRLLGLPFNLTSHMARHAFADKALEKTQDLRVLQEMLGHDSFRTTENYVADLRGEHLDMVSQSVYADDTPPGEGNGENYRETFEQLRPVTAKARKTRKRRKTG